MPKVTSWKELSLREKIGQTVICRSDTDRYIKLCGSIKGFAERYPVGGIFNNGNVVKGLLVGENDNFRGIVAELNKYLRVPVITVADCGFFAQKGGLILPPQMALGATRDEDLAYGIGEYQAENFKKTGITWGLWPVCDLNISKKSPITDSRSVSDDPELTVKIVKSELEAMKKAGVVATIKHYPGPPFDEESDPHVVPIDNETPFDFWMATHGKMYKDLIKAGVPAIMTGHINLVSYQTEKIDGKYPPATMSYELTTQLLREELGFEGVTVTDALEMGGFSGEKALENTVRSFLAGNDMLLWPMFEYIDEMEKRILSGKIDEKILDAAVERIWNLKQEYSVLDEGKIDSDKDIDFFKERILPVAEKSLTLIQDPKKNLPLNKEKTKNVLIIITTPSDAQYNDLCYLKTTLEKYGCNVNIKRKVEIVKEGM